MADRKAFTCDRCGKFALDEVPKDWIVGTNPTEDGVVATHVCGACVKVLNDLQPWLDWLTTRMARWVHESKSHSLGDLLAWNVHGETKLEDLWDDYRSGFQA